MDEQIERRKKMQAEALGKLIYEQYYSRQPDAEVPRVSADGVSFVYPGGLNAKEKDAFDSYIKKLKRESEKSNDEGNL